MYFKTRYIQNKGTIYANGFLCILRTHASVAELVDALDSKSSNGNIVRVRVSPEAHEKTGLYLFFCKLRNILQKTRNCNGPNTARYR